jgi:hypothetical protein
VDSPLWVAVHSRVPMAPDALGAAFSAIERALAERVVGRCPAHELRPHLGLAVWFSDGESRLVDHDPALGDLAIHDGLPIGFDRVGSQGPGARAVAEALERDPSLIAHLLPAYASVRLAGDRLRLANDVYGYAPVAVAQTGTRSVWSNSPLAAGLLAFGRLERSAVGWATRIAHDRYYFGTTPVKGVGILAPESIVVAANAPDAPRTASGDLAALMGGVLARGEVPNVADRAEEALAAVQRSVVALDLGAITVDLSGGRDSRVIAATALRHGRPDALLTATPPEIDTVVAAQLVEAAHLGPRWVHHDRVAPLLRHNASTVAGPEAAADVLRHAAADHIAADGYAMSSVYAGLPDDRPRTALTLSGRGGEVGRGFMYTPAYLANAAERMDSFWAYLGRSPRTFRPEHGRLLADRSDDLRRRLGAAGIRGLRQLDYFYLAERVRGWHERRKGTAIAYPFFTLAFMQAVLAQPIEVRLAAGLFREISDRCVPAWAGVPFAAEVAGADGLSASDSPVADANWANPAINDLASLVAERFDHDDLIDGAATRPFLNRRATDGLVGVKTMRQFNPLLEMAAFNEAVALANARAAAGDAGLLAADLPAPVEIAGPPKASRAVVVREAVGRAGTSAPKLAKGLVGRLRR